jgi:hypothetical protein
MSVEEIGAALERENLQNSLEEQRNSVLEGKPDHGELADLGDKEVLYCSRGYPEGAKLFVYGEIDTPEHSQQEVLREAGEETISRLQNYVSMKYGLDPNDIEIESGDIEGDYNINYFKL